MATLKKSPSRSGPNFHNGDDLRKKKQDAKRDGLSPKYGESREPPANKTGPKKPSSKKLSSKKLSSKKSK